jgi:hypothetical protein
LPHSRGHAVVHDRTRDLARQGLSDGIGLALLDHGVSLSRRAALPGGRPVVQIAIAR